MSIEAMKQALDALGYVMSHGAQVQIAKDILTQAIEQAQKKTAASPNVGKGFIDGAWHCQCGKAYEVTCISSKPKGKSWKSWEL